MTREETSTMTVEQPLDSAHVWFINATGRSVDIYVNHADQPALTDVKSLEVGPEFKVAGKDSTPYGNYTFSARPKAALPSVPPLAAVSIVFDRGKSFSAVLQDTPTGEQRFSVYENDFSASGGTSGRMTVRHNASQARIDWTIAPKQFKPEIPVDQRSGTLLNGQWQVATDVVQNDYRFEALVGNTVVAVHPDLELEHEKDRTVYVVGDLGPTADPNILRQHVLQQEFQLPPGPARPGQVTAPADPVRTTDENAAIEFTCEPLELWHTHAATTQVTAIDPDGVVTNLSVDRVDPEGAHIVIAGNTVTPATAIGGEARATVEVLPDVPAGAYEVAIGANDGSLGHRAICLLPVMVKPITVTRLRDQIDRYQASGDIEASVADDLRALLDQAQQHLDAGDILQACADLKDFLTLLGSEKGKAVREAAHDELVREAKAVRSDLGCG
jgi:hypothetical protein